MIPKEPTAPFINFLSVPNKSFSKKATMAKPITIANSPLSISSASYPIFFIKKSCAICESRQRRSWQIALELFHSPLGRSNSCFGLGKTIPVDVQTLFLLLRNAHTKETWSDL